MLCGVGAATFLSASPFRSNDGNQYASPWTMATASLAGLTAYTIHSPAATTVATSGPAACSGREIRPPVLGTAMPSSTITAAISSISAPPTAQAHTALSPAAQWALPAASSHPEPTTPPAASPTRSSVDSRRRSSASSNEPDRAEPRSPIHPNSSPSPGVTADQVIFGSDAGGCGRQVRNRYRIDARTTPSRIARLPLAGGPARRGGPPRRGGPGP